MKVQSTVYVFAMAVALLGASTVMACRMACFGRDIYNMDDVDGGCMNFDNTDLIAMCSVDMPAASYSFFSDSECGGIASTPFTGAMYFNPRMQFGSVRFTCPPEI